MKLRRIIPATALVAAAAGILLLAFTSGGPGPAGAAGTNVIIAIDDVGSLNAWTSLALDNVGNPVVSYYDSAAGDLRVLHCNNADCSLGASIENPDSDGDVGQHTSLVLDSEGYPVVSYYDVTNRDLKLMHCNDPNCDSNVNGSENITSPDTPDNVGKWNSLALDAIGNPVVSYHRSHLGGTNLMLMHCNDPNCEGGDESITSLDTENGAYTSLALYFPDAHPLGVPVVSYAGFTQIPGASGFRLKLLRCIDPNCEPGFTRIGPADPCICGAGTSLALDASDNPVVSFYNGGAGGTVADLRVLHCTNPSCSGDNTNNITRPDWPQQVGQWNSLVLDCNDFDPNARRCESLTGNPVVSYWRADFPSLKVLHCDDPNCDGGAPGDTIVVPELDPNAGRYTSLALDDRGNPVISYQVGSSLTILHCGNPSCTGEKPDSDGDGCTDEQELQPKSQAALGGGRDPNYFWDFYDTPAGMPPPERDKMVNIIDIAAVVLRFGTVWEEPLTKEEALTEALTPPPDLTSYHAAFDRDSPIPGENLWKLLPPDGNINIIDIAAVVVQFGHTCA